MQPARQTQLALTTLAILALGGVAYVAQPILAPLALAFVTAIILSPVQTGLRRLGLPMGAAATLTFVAVLCALVIAIFLIEPFISDLYAQAPALKYELRRAMEGVRAALGGLSDLSNEVETAISPDGGAGGAAGEADDDGMSIPTLGDALFLAPAIAAQVMVFAGGLFFVLLSRDDMYRWLARAAKVPSEMFRAADRLVARYFIAITIINLCFGSIVALVMHLIGLPNAPLWGAVAALMNFVLYLGPALFAMTLLVAGVLVFDGLYSGLPALAFVLLNICEGQFITPTLVGRHMRVNPLLIFLSLCLLLWLWGAIGGIVAIPLLVWGQSVLAGLKQPALDAAAPAGAP